MPDLYPLKFRTIYKDKIWGGQKIKTILGKDFGKLPNCGETWEISGVRGNVSKVKEGEFEGCDLLSIIDHFKGAIVGDSIFEKYGDSFPLLVKFIDANDDLSIQVHPGDDLAMERHKSLGKTEMWYVFQADEGAKLNAGFNRPLNQAQYLEYFENGKLMDILNWVDVENDDVFFLPAGRVHSIGKGCLLAEIQQSSDVTYRMYDFDRVDDSGNTRELHTGLALDAIDFTFHDEYKSRYADNTNKPVDLVECAYFNTRKLHFNKKVTRNYSALDSFVIFVCMDGALDLGYSKGQIQVQKGEAILLPACEKEITLHPKPFFKMLESYIPTMK